MYIHVCLAMYVYLSGGDYHTFLFFLFSKHDFHSCCHFQVFNVDFGDMSLVLPSDVRIMKDDFMTLPFQAIECSLSDKEASDMGSTE